MTGLTHLVRRRTGGRLLASTSALLILAACEYPTSAPQLDTRWIVPTQGTTISVASLLPSGVAIKPDSSAFTVAVAGVTVTRSLAQDCAQCATANGTTVPKPAFTATASSSTSLPAQIASATLASGSLQFTLQNNYNFDPIRPAAGVFGYAVLTVTNNGVVIGKDSVNGATTAMAPGSTLARTIPLSGTVTGSAPVVVTVTINSPAGDPITMDASRTIVLTATPTNISIATASLNVSNQTISTSTTLDLSGIDSSITRHVTSGSLLLHLVNPWPVTGTLTVTFQPVGAAAITKSISLASGTTDSAIAFTEVELQQLLGNKVIIAFSGPVSASAPVTVTPKQSVVATSKLDLSLHIGG